MLLYWYTCISMNTYCYRIYYISLETVWWALLNTSLIMQIHLVIYEILADEAFTATDVLISQSFVVTPIPPTYIQIALIWGFLAQLGLRKSVHWLWRYKLNKVCDKFSIEFSCVNPIQGFFSWLTLRFWDWAYSLRLQK